MAGTSSTNRRRLSLNRWVVGTVVVALAVSIGLPLVGIGVFHATDVLGTLAPWAAETPFHFRPDNPLVTDTMNAVTPMRSVFRDRVWSGDLPLWNTYAGAGGPLAAVPNVGSFSPLNLAYLLLPLWLAPLVTKLVGMAVALVFTYLLARRLGRSGPASAVAALVFTSSAFVVVWTNWPQEHVAALIPALFWAVERSVASGRVWSVWPVTIVGALMWFEGFPSVTVYALVTAGVYALVRAWYVHGRGAAEPGSDVPRGGAEVVRTLGALLGAVVLSVGVAAIQLLPFAAFLRGIAVLDARELGARWHLPWELLGTAVVPDGYGNPVDRVITYRDFLYTNYVEAQSFIGATTLVLVVAAAIWGARRWGGAAPAPAPTPARKLREDAGYDVFSEFSRGVPRGVAGFVWGALAVGIVIVYFGGPLLWVVTELPVVGANFIGRYRAVIGLLVAVLAGVGFDAIVAMGREWGGARGAEAGSEPGATAEPSGSARGRGAGRSGSQPARGAGRGSEAVRAVVAGGVVTLVLVVLGMAMVEEAADLGLVRYLAVQAFLPVAVLVVAAGVAVATRRGWDVGRFGVAAPALVVVAALVALAAATGFREAYWAVRAHGVLYVGAFVAGAVALTAGVWFARLRALPVAAVALPVLLAVEAVAFAYPWYARTPHDLFYPETTTHQLLEAQLGHDRFAAAGNTMAPGTNMVYDLRSVTAHAHQFPEYRQYLNVLDPVVYDFSRTLPYLPAKESVATSPLLDRAGARFWVTSPHDRIPGSVEVVREASSVRGLRVGESITGPIPAGPARGVVLGYVGWDELEGEVAVAVEVRGPDGGRLVRGVTPLHVWVGPGELFVAFPEIGVPEDAAVTVAIVPGVEEVLAGDGGGAVGLAEVGASGPGDGGDGIVNLRGSDDALALSVVRPDEGGTLDLVRAGGAVVYERTSALPRIRWAPRAIVETDLDHRFGALLSPGLEDDVVVLSAGQPDSEPGAADVVVLEDSGDVIEVEVTAEASGHLVVAESIQHGWHATLDGEPAEIVAADHAFGAVEVGPGQHVVQLRYHPPGWTAGQVLTWLSLAALAAVVVVDRGGWRRSRGHHPARRQRENSE